jgi:5,6-dimethylbenzimidazole synthase
MDILSTATGPFEGFLHYGREAMFEIKKASRDDIACLTTLIERSVRDLQRDDYTREQIDAALASVYGVDTTLVDDGTYFLGTCDGEIVACGGWSKRRTLYGGDVWSERDDDELDPVVDAAKIRAFFVAPGSTRRGYATRLLAVCEAAARAAGFRRFELAATLTGVPLYERRGYVPVARDRVPLANDLTLPVVRMIKEAPPDDTTVASDDFAKLERLMRIRRDVRHFRDDRVCDADIERAIGAASLAPSVGYSQPWRWIRIDSQQRREAMIASHANANALARAGAHAARGEEYGKLTLSGLATAPVHLAVCCDTATTRGGGLGRQTMPQTLRDSVVMAIYGFWLAARALGLGVGWISILDPDEATRVLDLPEGWELVAYLAVGRTLFDSTTPELAERGWERFDDRATTLYTR